MSDEVNVHQQKTGINTLDSILHGGIPRGHVVLLAGDSGTGKTLLGLEWLFRGFTDQGENGVYITLTEPITQALKNVREMEYYSDTAFDDGVHFTDLRTTLNLLDITDEELDTVDVDRIIDAIEEVVTQTEADRVVLDSITAMAYMLERKRLIRYFIFRLGAVLDNLDCTTILTSEVGDDSYSVFGVEEFISDAIIKLEQEPLKDDLVRTLQIVKMRGISYESQEYTFNITGNGIELVTVDIPLEYLSSSERISTGVSGIDDMCSGGVFDGSTTLVSGPAGTGKTLTSMHFLNESLKNGGQALYVGFEESDEQVLRNAEHFGFSFDEYRDNGKLQFRSRYAGECPPHEHLSDIIDRIESHDPDRVAIDSISAIKNIYPRDKYVEFAQGLVAYLKHQQVPAILTASTQKLMGAEKLSESNLSTLTDNLILLQYTEAQGSLSRVISVLKTRGTNHDDDIRQYDITEGGMKIGSPVYAFEGVMSGSARKVGKTVKELLRELFRDALGPMGEEEFKRLEEQGISEQAIHQYIAELIEESILSQEEGVKLKNKMLSVLREDSNDTVKKQSRKQFIGGR